MWKWIVLALVVLVVLRFLVVRRRRRIAARMADAQNPEATPTVTIPSTRSTQTPQTQTYSTQPPGTANLDDVDAVRPDIDMAALASARSQVDSEVPDGVLADALLDATPEQLRQIFGSVSHEVMAGAMGTGLGGVSTDDVQRRPIKAEELAQLQAMSESVDDLEIWGFAEKG
ncbi:hypothetical protein [Deinococcus sp.]|uniref:hypothetical protein n=1 Tax=Deinococcus sp. TaxID=47478 RepID=UPI003B5AE41A